MLRFSYWWFNNAKLKIIYTGTETSRHGKDGCVTQIPKIDVG